MPCGRSAGFGGGVAGCAMMFGSTQQPLLSFTVDFQCVVDFTGGVPVLFKSFIYGHFKELRIRGIRRECYPTARGGYS